MTLYGHWIGIGKAKGLMGNFISWCGIIHNNNEIKSAALSETSGKRTIVLNGNKVVERIHVDKSSKSPTKRKLTTIFGS